MEEIKDVVVITPAYNEPLQMYVALREKMDSVKDHLAGKGISMMHFFLDDGSRELPDDFPILVKHMKNQGLWDGVFDGYKNIFSVLKKQTDLIVRMDSQEHNPFLIPEIVDHFNNSPVQAAYLPVWYWIKGQPRPKMVEIFGMIREFAEALAPIDSETIALMYNKRFPTGFQVYRRSALEKLIPFLEEGEKVFRRKFKANPTWGIDLMAMIFSAHKFPGGIDFLFGGWSEPWLQNRGEDKIKIQDSRTSMVLETMTEILGKK